MSHDRESHREEVSQEFQNILNRHGYGFQYSILKVREDLEKRHRSGWEFEASEFPVEVQGRGTRIDFILKCVHNPVYMIAECKRANPAFSNWCFARAPYVQREEPYKSIILERLQRNNDLIQASAIQQFVGGQEPYHIALEVKSRKPGDIRGGRPEAIEEAATQVCRGMNGMVELLARNPKLFQNDKHIGLLPVIFTTAEIWVSEVDLSTADLASGKVELTGTNFSKKDWILYQYHTSPGLKHSFSPPDCPSTLGALMEAEYIRTIPLVSPAGILDFLNWSLIIKPE
jgi:hypothetical protein